MASPRCSVLAACLAAWCTALLPICTIGSANFALAANDVTSAVQDVVETTFTSGAHNTLTDPTNVSALVGTNHSLTGNDKSQEFHQNAGFKRSTLDKPQDGRRAISMISPEDTEDSRRLDRHKREDVYIVADRNNPPNVSRSIKQALQTVVLSNSEKEGYIFSPKQIYIELDIRVKSVKKTVPISLFKSERKYLTKDSTIVRNDDNYDQTISSTEIILKTTITQSSTISQTNDISGELEFPLPLKKIAFKFIKSSSTTSTKSEEISKKLPSQKVALKPHSKKKITSTLYGYDILDRSWITFELAEDSTYTVTYYAFGYDWISGFKKRTYPLKSALQSFVKPSNHSHPIFLYDKGVPTVEFKDKKVYLKNFLIEHALQETELESHIENVD